MTRLAPVLACLGAVLAWAPAAGAPAKDVRMKKATAAPAAVAGGTIDVSASAQARRLRLSAKQLSFVLSSNRKLDRRDIALKKRRAAARGRNPVAITATVRVPASAKAGVYHVLVCARVKDSRPANNCAASSRLRLLSVGEPNPLTVTPSADPSRSTTTTIGAAGGTISATGADGASYELTVPANALLSPEEIVMTPLSGVEGLPLGGQLAAGVKLEPEGLSFNRPASLSIVPAGGAKPTLVPFTGAGSGGNVHLHLARLSGTAAVFDITHFSFFGLGSSSTPGFDRFGNVIPEGRAAQMRHFIQRALSEERGATLGGLDASSRLTKELTLAALYVWGNEVVLPLASAGLGDTDTYEAAVRAYLGWLREMQLLGRGDDAEADKNIRRLRQEILKLLREGWKRAWEREFEKCLASDLSSIPRIRGYLRTSVLLGSPDPAPGAEIDPFGFIPVVDHDAALERLRRCFRFELNYEFSFQGDERGGTTLTHTWNGRVRALNVLVTVADMGPATGSKDLEYQEFTLVTGGPPDHECTGTFSGTFQQVEPFQVTDVEIDLNRAPPRYVLLRVKPGKVVEHTSSGCRDSNPASDYVEAFEAVHASGREAGGVFRIARLTIGSGNIVASGSLAGSGVCNGGGANAPCNGESTWTLRHVPLAGS